MVEEFPLADRADDFASACILLLRNPCLGEALSDRAYKRFLERWTWDSFENTAGTVVQECLARSKRTNMTEAPYVGREHLGLRARGNADE